MSNTPEAQDHLISQISVEGGNRAEDNNNNHNTNNNDENQLINKITKSLTFGRASTVDKQGSVHLAKQEIKLEDSIQHQQSIESQMFKSFSVNSPNNRKFVDDAFFLGGSKVPPLVQEQYDQLFSFASNLSSRISGIVDRSEEDFLKVYKQQMKFVLFELNKLKKRIEDEDVKLQKDQKILILTEERNYYRREALRLDKISREAERQRDEFQFQNNEFKKDVQYYESLIVDLKRENKQIKVELLHLYDNRNNLPSEMKQKLSRTPSSVQIISPRQSSTNITSIEQLQQQQGKSNNSSSNGNQLDSTSNRFSSPFFKKKASFSQQLVEKAQIQKKGDLASKEYEEDHIKYIQEENLNLRSQLKLIRSNNKQLKRLFIDKSNGDSTTMSQTLPKNTSTPHQPQKQAIQPQQSMQKISALFRKLKS